MRSDGEIDGLVELVEFGENLELVMGDICWFDEVDQCLSMSDSSQVIRVGMSPEVKISLLGILWNLDSEIKLFLLILDSELLRDDT